MMSKTSWWKVGAALLLAAATTTLLATATFAHGGGGGGRAGGGTGAHVGSFGAHPGGWSGHVGGWSGHAANWRAPVGHWSGRAGTWTHVAPYGRYWHNGGWYAHRPWNYGYWHRNWYGYRGRWWPWYGYGRWPSYGGYYGYYPYTYSYGYAVPYGNDYGNYVEQYPNEYVTTETVQPDVAQPSNFYTDALEAFRGGNYANAVRLASHAAIDEPNDANVHLLLSLGMFALGEFRGAAMEAHAVVASGSIPDWPKVYRFYGNVDAYTQQLRALEQFVRENPKSSEGRFLLGFQYAVAGHSNDARSELLQALNLTPQDRLAAQLLTKVGGTVPPEIARQQSASPGLR